MGVWKYEYDIKDSKEERKEEMKTKSILRKSAKRKDLLSNYLGQEKTGKFLSEQNIYQFDGKSLLQVDS